jgi:hypothetical protein
VIEDHTPNHCSAPNSSNRSTSVNPSFATRRMELSLLVVAHGVEAADERQFVDVQPVVGGVVHQVVDGAVGEQQRPDLLAHQLGCLSARF